MPRKSLPETAPGEYRSFGDSAYYVPDELPPETEIETSDDLRDAIENAVLQLGRLGGIDEETDTSPLLYKIGRAHV